MFDPNCAFNSEYLTNDINVLWKNLTSSYNLDEDFYVKQLIACSNHQLNNHENQIVVQKTAQLIKNTDNNNIINKLMNQYNLNTKEGILLLCIAEALIRIPDRQTSYSFICDCLNRADWHKHLGKSESVFVNAMSQGLNISRKILGNHYLANPVSLWQNLFARLGEPIILLIIKQAVNIISNHFILGKNINEALKKKSSKYADKQTFSFDMLGESAITMQDAKYYQQNYMNAIEMIGLDNQHSPLPANISIKLSALHPRYEASQFCKILPELSNIVLEMINLAKTYNVGITIDAEESDRLEIYAKLFQYLLAQPICQAYNLLGYVVQAYSKRALPLLMWLLKLSMQHNIKIPVRLVKGAYWDNEIKQSQEYGEQEYSVFTRKEATDLSYLVCAKFLLQYNTCKYLIPKFATHNPYTIASVLAMNTHIETLEFQRLHGMGEEIYNNILTSENINVRVYTPVGNHRDLLPYLIRRLLENSANNSITSFADTNDSLKNLTTHPSELLKRYHAIRNTSIPLATEMFKDRQNSQGFNLFIDHNWKNLTNEDKIFAQQKYSCGAMINGQIFQKGDVQEVINPANYREIVGYLYNSTTAQIEQAIQTAHLGFKNWQATPVTQRAKKINKFAELINQHRGEFLTLLRREAGKTLRDSIDEIREAIDFCRYYAVQAINLQQPLKMPGPTGESNKLFMVSRGVFFCISPWNFPLAIFCGQIMAALVTGNTVIAKPAEQTSLIAALAVKLAWQAGIAKDALQLLPGSGATIGNQVLQDCRISGVCFTGSTITAQLINQTIASRNGAIIPFIAETGGQNTMIVDSTSLPEQVVKDVINSAFTSAGQRCSALRVLYIPKKNSKRILSLLTGAMQELIVGDPEKRNTDIGPVISQLSQSNLNNHINNFTDSKISQTPISTDIQGYFVAPTVFLIPSISILKAEHFGPILHIVLYEEIEKVIEEINNTNFGLTLGIHSRNETFYYYLAQRINVGNIYINRNQIGAVVGVQPFGGIGLSGTGPKAGGPNYLPRFMVEKHLCINTTAIGGNPFLLRKNN